MNFADVYRPAEIHGVKFDDANGNHQKDDGEAGVGGVTVYSATFDPVHPTAHSFAWKQAMWGTVGLLSALAQLRVLGAAASLSGDYKALVCLFLAGGNDANNLIVPSDTTGYNAYAAGRGALALPRSGLLGVNVTANDGHTYGLHPAMPELQALFNQRRATSRESDKLVRRIIDQLVAL